MCRDFTVLVLQCSTRLATCNFSENELIATFARVFTSLKLPGIQYWTVSTVFLSARNHCASTHSLQFHLQRVQIVDQAKRVILQHPLSGLKAHVAVQNNIA